MRGSDSTPPRFRVAAVILNYRTPKLVVDCLETLQTELDPERDVAVVVDNASGDGSAERIASEVRARGWQPILLVEPGENRGFAAGNNAGIAEVDADAYLLLNSDTLVRAGAVEVLWRALEVDPARGLVSPRLEWPDESPQISCFRLHTPWSELIGGAGSGPVRRLLAWRDVPIPVSEEAFEPEWTSFAAVLIRAQSLRAVGGLDEGFFMYFEDADYCRRLRAGGWAVWHEPAARVVHLRGGSSPVKALSQAKKRRPRYYYASRERYFRNAFGGLGLLAANLMWTAGWVVASAREWLEGRPRHAVERELLDRWRG